MGTTSSSSRADLEAVLRTADVISIHCPLTPATRGLMGCAGKICAFVSAFDLSLLQKRAVLYL
jgi:hypothetical protein